MSSSVSALVLALALAVPAVAATDLADRNLDWLLAFAGLAAAPAGDAIVHENGLARETSAADAFAALAARAGSVALSTLGASDGPSPTGEQIGDVWVLERGDAPCPAPALFTPTPIPPMYLGGGMWIYEGGAGASQTTQSDSGMMLSWTLKTYATYGDGGHTMAGQSDFFCVEYGEERLSFPFLDGVARPNGDA